MHTLFSEDSLAPAEAMIERAVSLGLTEIAITDHLDFNRNTQIPRVDLDLYTAFMQDMHNKYKSRISVLTGLEVGLTPETVRLADGITGKYPLDFIICSTHDIFDEGLYYGEFFKGKTKEEAYGLYFNEILSVLKQRPDFCVYGHLDYIERYASYADNSVILADYAEVVDKIFIELISQGKGVEVNASGFRYGLGHTNVQPEFLRRYRELGGEIVTVGSDAHKPQHIAEYFKEARDILLEAGFEYVTRYKNKKPYWVKL